MSTRDKRYISLSMWIITLVLIGSLMGSLMQMDVAIWYNTLNRSSLTPPNYIFSIVWAVLYTLIATCGWVIWRARTFDKLVLIKSLYVAQLLLNWSWTPLFFWYHLVGTALICLLAMDTVVAMIIYLAYPRIRSVSFAMLPYLVWLLFATYLNFYIWQYN